MTTTHMLAKSVSVKKYLLRYAETEAQLATTLLKNCEAFAHVLCLPVYKESTECLDHFIEQAINNHALLIVVLNQPANIAPRCVENIALHERMTRLYPSSQSNQHLTCLKLPNNSMLLLVDRYSPGLAIDHQQGVGLARKIAADIALALMANKIINSTWIHCSDADAKIPPDYFQSAHHIKSGKIAALIYPHKHIDNSCATQKVLDTTQLYEQRLQHYVNGLRLADSPYAYHTLGSTLCLHANHYAQVRGFPKRAAGEDFYILNKLRKTGAIKSLAQPTLHISARQSDRTPFGTGAAVENLLSTNDYKLARIFYHPMLFAHLGTAINWLNTLSVEYFEQPNAFNHSDYWKNHLIAFAGESAKTLAGGFESLNFQRCFEHCAAQCKTPAAFNRHLHHWFDGFKTLKWLHTLRESDAGLANISLSELQQYQQRHL